MLMLPTCKTSVLHALERWQTPNRHDSSKTMKFASRISYLESIAQKTKYFWYCFSFSILFLAVSSSFCQEKLLVIRENQEQYRSALIGLIQELGEDFGIYQIEIDQNTDTKALAKKAKVIMPKIVVLMGAKPVRLFREAQLDTSSQLTGIPSVSLFASQLDKEIGSMPNAAGVWFDVPIVTGVINLRKVLGTSIKSVGVVHRSYLTDFIKENEIYCQKEKIQLVSCELADSQTARRSSLLSCLMHISDQKKVDALWVPNDSELLSNALIKEVWLPFTKKCRLPIIVGDDRFAEGSMSFGILSVRPDYVEYGMQAAELVYNIADEGWTTEAKTEFPLSVYKVINCDQLETYYAINKKSLMSIDQIACLRK